MKVRHFGLDSLRPFFFRKVCGNVLEIGPLDRPAIKSAKYFDALSTAELKEWARVAGRNPDTVPFIHYHSRGGDLSIVDERFDCVVSCHCIEHQPDIVRHLRQVHDLLKPGGAYFLVVPDRRYCLDYFIPESSPEDMKAAQGNEGHTLQTLVRHATETTHNKSYLHWLGIHGKLLGEAKRVASAQIAKQQHATGRYIDAHAWQFTPESFATSVMALQGLTNLSTESVNPTFPGFAEFTAILRRPK
jgi:SAM-dependent methyltransferase